MSDVAESGFGDVLDAARRLPKGRTVWIGIDGFGGAGKSTLAAALARALPTASVVQVDDFWGPTIPEWDWDRFRRQVVVPLLAGRAARYQRWDWDRDVGGAWLDVAPGRTVIVEGVSATRSEAGVPWDLTVWVDAPEDVRLRRAVERDGEGMLHRWLEDWMPSEQRYVRTQDPRARADLVVRGTSGEY